MSCATEGVKISRTPFYVKECEHETQGDDKFMQHRITLRHRILHGVYGYRLYRTGSSTSSRSSFIVKGTNKPNFW